MATRPPAPEPLETVREFVNTLDLETGVDDFVDPAALAGWLEQHELLEPGTEIGVADLQGAVEVREALRAMLLHNSGRPIDVAAVEVLNDAAGRMTLAPRFASDGRIGLEGRGRGVDGAIATLMAIVFEAIADGTWARLKACWEDRCHWAFYDRSRNRSSQWCVMAVCGNRNKARAFRARAKGVSS